MAAPTARVARPADVGAMVAALTTGLLDDPVWGPAFPDSSGRATQAAALWRLVVTASLRYPWTFVSPDARRWPCGCLPAASS
jgi:hypothetical protein